MKTILISGIDGSGKTTILDYISKLNYDDISALYLPKIKESLIKNNHDLKKVAEFINQMTLLAEKEGNPSLKVIAMFSSMLIFKDLSNNLNKNIVTERFPLIDTIIFAQLYNKYLSPKLLDIEIQNWLNSTYKSELIFLINKINIKPSKKGLSYDLLFFIDEFLSNKKNLNFNQVNKIFNLKLPHKIYFLDVNIDTVLKRISLRNVKELHETKVMLKTMKNSYLDLFDKEGVDYELVKNETFKDAERLIQKIII